MREQIQKFLGGMLQGLIGLVADLPAIAIGFYIAAIAFAHIDPSLLMSIVFITILVLAGDALRHALRDWV